jgi:hypothetical protein
MAQLYTNVMSYVSSLMRLSTTFTEQEQRKPEVVNVISATSPSSTQLTGG